MYEIPNKLKKLFRMRLYVLKSRSKYVKKFLSLSPSLRSCSYLLCVSLGLIEVRLLSAGEQNYIFTVFLQIIKDKC